MIRFRFVFLAAMLFSTAATAASGLVTFEEVVLPTPTSDVRVEASGPLSFASPLCNPICHSAGIPVLDISNLYGHIDLSASGPLGGAISDGLSIGTVSGERFTLHSAYFGMTHPFDGPLISVRGYSDGQVIGTTQLFPQQMAGLVSFGWTDLDVVSFSVRIQTGYVTIDDISVSVVPEPAVPALLLVGLTALGLFRRWTRQGD